MTVFWALLLFLFICWRCSKIKTCPCLLVSLRPLGFVTSSIINFGNNGHRGWTTGAPRVEYKRRAGVTARRCWEQEQGTIEEHSLASVHSPNRRLFETQEKIDWNVMYFSVLRQTKLICFSDTRFLHIDVQCRNWRVFFLKEFEECWMQDTRIFPRESFKNPKWLSTPQYYCLCQENTLLIP